MNQKFIIFDVISMNEELENEFHNFFNKYNLSSLFTNEHRATSIKVTDNDLRSVINPNNKYHNILKEFGNYLSWSTDNKSYEEALFKIIYEARSFQGLMNNIKKLKDYIENGINVEHMYNMWNIVWYADELK